MPLQYLAGMAANSDSRYQIFQGILRYRRYPADLFSATGRRKRRSESGIYLTDLVIW